LKQIREKSIAAYQEREGLGLGSASSGKSSEGAEEGSGDGAVSEEA
jgi:hypothetical protein